MRPRPGLDRYPLDRPLSLAEQIILHPVRHEWSDEDLLAYHLGFIVADICPYLNQPIHAYRKRETYAHPDPLS